MWVLFLKSLRYQFSLSQQSYLYLQLYLSYLECFQPVHSLTAPSHALAIFSEGNWEQLHSCAVLKVGLESQIAELLGERLHGSGLVYISSQLVHLALWASFLIHTSFTEMIQSFSSVTLIFMLRFNYCPDFELFWEMSWEISQIALLVSFRIYWLLFRIRAKISER